VIRLGRCQPRSAILLIRFCTTWPRVAQSLGLSLCWQDTTQQNTFFPTETEGSSNPRPTREAQQVCPR
ncbi:unnamed protein product, partial [Ectocarpus sp. 12 AP-2014]